MILKQLKIFIVDDHHSIISGFKAIFKDFPEIRVVGESTDGLQVLEWFKKNNADILILDIKLKSMDGVEILKRFQETKVKTKVIVVSEYEPILMLEDCLSYGAKAYLHKIDGHLIVDAIYDVYYGKTYVSEYAKNRFIEFSPSITDIKDIEKEKELQKILSSKEIEVLKLVVKGHTANEISSKLGMSPNTVKSHNRRIRDKVNVKTSIGLFKWAFIKRLIKL